MPRPAGGTTRRLPSLRRPLPGSATVLLAGATLFAAAALQAQRPVGPKVRAELRALAGPYPLLTATDFPPDSAVLVFEDSSLAREDRRPGDWMFGPPVTAEEAAGCPPPKVLGRKLARLLYRRLGRGTGPGMVVVEVRAPGAFSATSVRMYYYLPELRESWAGDSAGPR